MLDLYKTLNRQVILTSTLKDEEYSNNKYSNKGGVTSLDYSVHEDCKILTKDKKDEFKELVSNFDGIIM